MITYTSEAGYQEKLSVWNFIAHIIETDVFCLTFKIGREQPFAKENYYYLPPFGK